MKNIIVTVLLSVAGLSASCGTVRDIDARIDAMSGRFKAFLQLKRADGATLDANGANTVDPFDPPAGIEPIELPRSGSESLIDPALFPELDVPN